MIEYEEEEAISGLVLKTEHSENDPKDLMTDTKKIKTLNFQSTVETPELINLIDV